LHWATACHIVIEVQSLHGSSCSSQKLYGCTGVVEVVLIVMKLVR
jgi:hypothetical protein